jgi:hypothetical protein
MKGMRQWVIKIYDRGESRDRVLIALANCAFAGILGVLADDLIGGLVKVEVVGHLFRGTVWSVVKCNASVAPGELETVLVLRVYRFNTGHDPGEWSVTEVETVTSVSVGFGELLVRVEMLKHLLELGVPTLPVSRDIRVVLVCKFFMSHTGVDEGGGKGENGSHFFEK